MNDEKVIRAEMRLWALEPLVSNPFAIMCASNPEWVELFERTRRQMIEGAGQRIFPEVTDSAVPDPEASDKRRGIVIP